MYPGKTFFASVTHCSLPFGVDVSSSQRCFIIKCYLNFPFHFYLDLQQKCNHFDLNHFMQDCVMDLSQFKFWKLQLF